MNFTEEVIDEVKKWRCLYDRTAESDRSKEEIWLEIASKLGTSVAEVQGKWKNIRDVMVRSYKKNDRIRKGIKLSPNEKPTVYKYAYKLGFLVATLRNSRSCFGSVDDDDGDNEVVPYNNVEHPTIVIKDEIRDSHCCMKVTSPNFGKTVSSGFVEYPNIPTVPQTSFSDVVPATVITTPFSQTLSVTPFFTNANSNKRQMDSRELNLQNYGVSNAKIPAIVSTCNSYPLQESTQNQSSGSEWIGRIQQPDEVSLFLSSIQSTIRKLPPRAQAEVRYNIHKIVHEAEMKHLFSEPKGDNETVMRATSSTERSESLSAYPVGWPIRTNTN